MSLPAFLQTYQSRGLSAQVSANLGTASPPYLSIEGNRFTLIDSGGNTQAIGAMDPQLGLYAEVVIIDANEHKSKIYYDKPFDPNAAGEPPACWSDNGVGPSRQAARPQASTCADCPQAVWGSKVSTVSGKGVQACSDYQKVALVVPGNPMVFLLRIPPNSLKNFRAYAEKFRGQQFDMDVILTRISFEQAGVGTLVFTPVSFIDEATNDLRVKAVEAKVADTMIGRTDQPRALPAPALHQPQGAGQAPPLATQPGSIMHASPAQQAPAATPFPAHPAAQSAPTPSSPPPMATSPSPNGAATPASPSEPAKRGRGRPKVDAAPVNAAPVTLAPFPVQPAAPAFGMAPSAPAPDPALASALGAIFGQK